MSLFLRRHIYTQGKESNFIPGIVLGFGQSDEVEREGPRSNQVRMVAHDSP